MSIATIKENTNYQKVDNAFVINRNDDEYKLALMRRKRDLKNANLENRLTLLEDKIDQIFKLLTADK